MVSTANGWVLRATGSASDMVADQGEVRRALALFADPDLGCELMALTSGVSRNLPGADLDGLCRAALDLPGGIGLYMRLNPVPAGLRRAARDADTVRRRWLYVDVDPIKDHGFKDSPATSAEKAAAGRVCDAVNERMRGAGWPAPVVVDSGNGYGLYWACDLPNDALAKAAYKRWLDALAAAHPDGAKIDTSVHNASRLVKLPGTWARKGAATPDRPHRPCEIVYAPARRELVTMDQLSAAGAPVPVPALAPAPRPAPAVHAAPGAGQPDGAYGRAALEAECARVEQAAERNNALNRAAFSLGQLVGGGVLSEAVVVDRLTGAARAVGLDRDPGCGERGIAATIASGLKAGKELPRAPERKSEPKAVLGKPDAKPGEKPARLTVRLSAITPQRVDWLIPGRVPKRFITVFAGRTGVGKSFVSCDLIARLTTGGEIPGAGGQRFVPGGALVISEDSHEYVLAPRLIALGADLSRVNAMTWEAMGKYHLSDTGMLESACNEVEGGVSLVMVDPPTNFLDEVDEHKNSEVRQLVMKVVEWAFTRDLAVLFVLHVNKQTGKGLEAVNRVMGSVAWVSTARIAHAFCLDPDDPSRGLWMPTKSNLGALPKGLAYRIVGEDPPLVEWLGEVDITADEAMNGDAKKPKREILARDWLVERFREKREWKSDDLFEAAEEEGISRNAIFDAKKMLNLPKARQDHLENGGKRWVWWVPSDWPPLQLPDNRDS